QIGRVGPVTVLMKCIVPRIHPGASAEKLSLCTLTACSNASNHVFLIRFHGWFAVPKFAFTCSCPLCTILPSLSLESGLSLLTGSPNFVGSRAGDTRRLGTLRDCQGLLADLLETPPPDF